MTIIWSWWRQLSERWGKGIGERKAYNAVDCNNFAEDYTIGEEKSGEDEECAGVNTKYGCT